LAGAAADFDTDGARSRLQSTTSGKDVARRGARVRIEGVSDPAGPDDLNENGTLLPGPGATLAGPTFESGSTPEQVFLR
jgi:hypothetical protein